ncbi:serine hydrolase domain-containing protein [Pseudemcibacter aquimaris]|uniref:serine hydrolase domain-containing protein n=1 Tax=Pseudemcibacter aquimaris TaxID=2857064 RepID=UPI00201343AE|nr:serine hydrolase [Pseudemcibacter aquimaris]MCC3861209.1 beta-lactamase family protein [Pseudemcibacter aquimaris]WDU57984.1 beta-lactamase family protein [Pseudemcibacter aquimaris]
MLKNLQASAIMLALSSTVAMAQNPITDNHLNAQVAGYKAAFTCSGVFNGGKAVEQINREELAGIYPAYREPLSNMPDAVIDRDEKYVSVKYSDTMPPRYVVWRDHLGCVQLPIGASLDDREYMPTIDVDKPEMPDANWPIGNKVGSYDNEKLNDIIHKAFDGKTYGDKTYTTAVLVTTPDKMLGEEYRDGFNIHTSHRTWSVAKSIAATVIGAAVDDGIVDVKAPADIEAWKRPGDPRGRITLENLLHMGSGLHHNRAGNRTDDVYFGGALMSDWSTSLSVEAEPGSRWKYANNDTMLAIRSLRESIGDRQKYMEYPFKEVLYKIGMLDTKLETDWDGNFIMSSQVWTTARDLGRLAVLYLNRGVWQGERILPDNWGDYVSTPAPSEPSRGVGYGAQWWLYPKSKFPELPADMYMANGNRGQRIMMIPDRNIAIIRRGHDDSTVAVFDVVAFTRDVLAAVE